jgi:hypothetical protein
MRDSVRLVALSICAIAFVFLSAAEIPAQSGGRLLPVSAATDGGSSSSAALPAGGEQTWEVPTAGDAHQEPFSRIGIGANISPLGIGINATTVLSDYFDARLMGNYFNYTSQSFEIEGYRATANLHLASMAASLDWYPFKSVWRFSPGVMFYNGNRFSGQSLITPGTDFSLDGKTFYSATANAATGATPFTATGALGLNRHPVAFTAAFGFGKFVPRSHRHWSFPSEFGVVFMGAPTVDMTPSGWVCRDKAQTQCSNISNPTNPVAQQFNTALQAQLVKWRRSAGNVTVYPMFSYSVVYSFNIR